MEALSKMALPVFLLAALCLSGCTEEKAKALRLAAESFKSEADAACTMGANSLKASVSMPPRTPAEISRNLAEAKKFGAAELEIIYSDSSIVDKGIAPALNALSKACEAHKQLAAIYTDLPRGYLLAANDVKRAQKHVVNVTLRFAKLAQVFDSLPAVGRDNIARIKIIEARAKAMAVTEEKVRTPLLDAVAEEIVENQAREALNRTQVLAQFAKATSLGEQLTQISIDYEQLSVADILESLQEFSSLYGDITGRTVVAQNAIERIKNVEVRIKNDPRLSPLLEVEVTQ